MEDEHLSSVLQQISKTFKLSESLAGVTLLAFGAGASDVFSSFSASEGGIKMASKWVLQCCSVQVCLSLQLFQIHVFSLHQKTYNLTKASF